jgi:periplasmic protein TonB
MKTVFFSLLILICSAKLIGQTDTIVRADSVKKDIDLVFTYAEVMPQFEGGEVAFFQYMQANIQYPVSAMKNKKQGTVYISFIVENDGSISNVEEVRGVAGVPELTAEAIRVISEMPKWKPGEMNGKKVRVWITKPVKFILK